MAIMKTVINKPNYIRLINRFWVINLEYSFTGNETKLYFYLLHVCNSLGWKNPFRNSLRQINNGTNISINSVKSAQKRLVESGLVFIKNGKPGNHYQYANKTEYTLTVSEIDTATDTHPDTVADTHHYTITDTHPDTIIKLKETKQLFDIFRKAYPGTKRGLQTELKLFLKKNKPEVVKLLLSALQKEIDNRNKLAQIEQFVPPWKNLSTWINKKCWEQEFPQINGKTSQLIPPAKGLKK